MTVNHSRVTKIFFDFEPLTDQQLQDISDRTSADCGMDEAGNLVILFGVAGGYKMRDVSAMNGLALPETAGVARVVGQESGDFTLLISLEGPQDNPSVIFTALNGAGQECGSVGYFLKERSDADIQMVDPLLRDIERSVVNGLDTDEGAVEFSELFLADEAVGDVVAAVERDSLKLILRPLIEADDNFLDYLNHRLNAATFPHDILALEDDTDTVGFVSPPFSR